MEVYNTQLSARESNLEHWKENDIYVNLMAELEVKMNRFFLEWLEDARERIINSEQETL